MKKRWSLFPLLLSLFLLQGCAGGLIVAAGTAVAVSSDERSFSTQMSDDNLALQALDKLTELDIDHRNSRINFIVNNGYVLIIGQVNDDAQKTIVGNEINKLKGVEEVYNQLRIKQPIGFTQQSRDSWITAKTKSQLTTHDKINSLQVKVVTEDGELFFIGRVDEQTANEATNIGRKIAGVKRVNRVFQIIPEK